MNISMNISRFGKYREGITLKSESIILELRLERTFYGSN